MKKLLVLGTACLLQAGALHAQPLMSATDAQVTAAELNAAVTYLLTEGQQQGMRDKEENLRRYLVDFMTFKLMAAEARKQGLDQQPDFIAELDSHTNRLLTGKLIDQHIADAKRPDFVQLAREAYLASPEQFLQPEQVNAAHIVVAVNDERSDEQALALINDLRQQLGKDLGQFGALAKAHSDDPSVEGNEGNLGFFDRATMVKPFSDAAFALKPGQLSEPVKTQFGYHLIHLLEKKPAQKVPFEQVRDELVAQQQQKFELAKRQELVAQVQGRKDIQVDEAAFEAFYQQLKQQANQAR